VLGLLACAAAAAAAPGAPPAPPAGAASRATAVLRNARGDVVGRATFAPLPGGGVWIEVTVAHLTPGVHGIHIHERGRCDPPDFATAGGHFNPRHRAHGLAHAAGAHAGDLPNLVVGETGTARYEAADVRLTLGEGPASLFVPGGTALIITADPDDQLTDPDGRSGARIVCGVITPAGTGTGARGDRPRHQQHQEHQEHQQHQQHQAHSSASGA
jgi:Cu-Zn family superoxide dismutase